MFGYEEKKKIYPIYLFVFANENFPLAPRGWTTIWWVLRFKCALESDFFFFLLVARPDCLDRAQVIVPNRLFRASSMNARDVQFLSRDFYCRNIALWFWPSSIIFTYYVPGPVHNIRVQYLCVWEMGAGVTLSGENPFEKKKKTNDILC